MQQILCPKGEILKLNKGTHIFCTSGIFWITWKNSNDILLRSGESLMIPGHVTGAIGEFLSGIDSTIHIANDSQSLETFHGLSIEAPAQG